MVPWVRAKMITQSINQSVNNLTGKRLITGIISWAKMQMQKHFLISDSKMCRFAPCLCACYSKQNSSVLDCLSNIMKNLKRNFGFIEELISFLTVRLFQSLLFENRTSQMSFGYTDVELLFAVMSFNPITQFHGVKQSHSTHIFD